MSELTEEQRAFLVGPDARMDGYYIGFDKTGNEFIDQILSAVAYAAKGAHGTEAWSYELEYGYGPVPADKTFEWLIQEAANDAAERLAAVGVAPEPEPEYEYAIQFGSDDEPWSDPSDDPHWLVESTLMSAGDYVARRVKAGAWERAEQEKS